MPTGFIYDTHAHSSEVSRCSRASGAQLAHVYKNAGYTGFFVTDHFFRSNTTVPPSLPWAEQVAMFMSGYEAAAAEGAKIGVDVFFGWEYSLGGSDILTYGLDAGWLLAHPDVCDWPVNEYFDRVRADGGFTVHAHPFREASYIEYIRLFPRKPDAVETYNACRDLNSNEMASIYAKFYGLRATSGTDLHNPAQENFGGVSVSKRFGSAADYGRALREGGIKIVQIYKSVVSS